MRPFWPTNASRVDPRVHLRSAFGTSPTSREASGAVQCVAPAPNDARRRASQAEDVFGRGSERGRVPTGTIGTFSARTTAPKARAVEGRSGRVGIVLVGFRILRSRLATCIAIRFDVHFGVSNQPKVFAFREGFLGRRTRRPRSCEWFCVLPHPAWFFAWPGKWETHVQTLGVVLSRLHAATSVSMTRGPPRPSPCVPLGAQPHREEGALWGRDPVRPGGRIGRSTGSNPKIPGIEPDRPRSTRPVSQADPSDKVRGLPPRISHVDQGPLTASQTHPVPGIDAQEHRRF